MEENRRIISYSLYGNNQRYTAPLLENSKIVAYLYPGWTIYVYHDKTVNQKYLYQLNQYGVVTINIEQFNYSHLPPKMWRFLPTADANIDIIIFRDADSIITPRERDLVMDWIESEKPIHIIRDHPLHIAPILAGMFGIKQDSFHILSELMQLIPANKNKRPHDYDQVFLADHLYPKIIDLALIHASFFKYWGENVVKIDPVKDGYNYIGAVYNDTERKKEKERKIVIDSKFINGIPYSMARLFRYRTRPIIYSSLFLNFLANIINKYFIKL